VVTKGREWSGCSLDKVREAIEQESAGMRRIGTTIICVVVVLSLGMGQGMAERISSVSRVSHSGDIVGTVECSGGSVVQGALVFIPGHSFMVKTDARGMFRIYSVPGGTYDVTVEIEPGEAVTVVDVVVRKKIVTDLGTIDACSDACSENGECPEGFYCAKAEGDCFGEGTCREMPDACPEIWDPVCGCDGNTYGNSCEAAAMGINVAYPGECSTASTFSSNADCPDVWDPVCGCDDWTYSNACEAAAMGVCVAYEGACHSKFKPFPGD
jgi:hypothetical protein